VIVLPYITMMDFRRSCVHFDMWQRVEPWTELWSPLEHTFYPEEIFREWPSCSANCGCGLSTPWWIQHSKCLHQ